MKKIVLSLVSLLTILSCTDLSGIQQQPETDIQNEETILWNMPEITDHDITVSGWLKNTVPDFEIKLRVTEDPEGMIVTKLVQSSELDAGLNFQLNCPSLEADKIYYYKTSVRINGKYSYSEPKQFKTEKKTAIDKGCYINGTATGVIDFDARSRMSLARDQADENKLRDRMYEKYMILEAGETFHIDEIGMDYSSRFTATLSKTSVGGTNGQICTEYYRGTLTDESSQDMLVPATGLYHIVVDLYTDTILVIPVTWGECGLNQDWTWHALKQTSSSRNSMTWEVSFPDLKESEFKFLYGKIWALEVCRDGAINRTVRINTNLGQDMQPGNRSIQVPAMKNATIRLEFNLSSGEVSDSFTYSITGETPVFDPNDYRIGLFGDAFPGYPTWEMGSIPAVWNSSESIFTNDAKTSGTMAYDIRNLQILSNKECMMWLNNTAFSLQMNVTLEGIAIQMNGTHIKFLEGGFYDVRFELTFEDRSHCSTKAIFTRKSLQ